MRSSALEYTGGSPDTTRSIAVLFDGRKLGHGGIGTYIDTLINGLTQQPEIELTVITRPGYDLSKHRWGSFVSRIEDSAKPYSFDEFFGFSQRIDFSKFDIFHEPHYTLPFRVPIPSVVTVHDLIHIEYPQHWYYPVVAAPMIRSALRRSDAIVTVSKASCRDLVELVRAKKSFIEKIQVIPNAFDEDLQDASLETSVDFPENTLLCVSSNLKPHKGVSDLVRAFLSIPFEDLVKRGHSDFQSLALAIVGFGAKDEQYARKVLGVPADCERIFFPGALSKAELASAYQQSLALMVPSYCEGFCLQVLEAHAFGLPVIARPANAVLEILNEEDVCCTDFSIESLQNIMVDRVKYLVKNREQSRKPQVEDRFRPEVVAQQMVSVYQSVIGGAVQ